MQDLEQALTDISAIREQMARGTIFRGYGPAALALTGVLALLAAAVQAYIFTQPPEIFGFVALWAGTAGLSVTVIAVEAARRSRQAHGGLADDMLRAAVEQFLPAAIAGALLTIVLLRTASAEAWMLPGLWQIVFSLGVFASCRSLPRPLIVVGVWYLGTGLLCLDIGNQFETLSGWTMGLPFGIGQLLAAGLLRQNYARADDEE